MVFLKISQDSEEDTCTRGLFMPAILLKKKFWYRRFPVNNAKFFRTPLVAASTGDSLMRSGDYIVTPLRSSSRELKIAKI